MMISRQPAKSADRQGLAIASGALCGLITLVIAGGVYWAFVSLGSGGEESAGGGSVDSEPDGALAGMTVTRSELRSGQCIQFDDSPSEIVVAFSILPCSTPHRAEITGRIEHPSAGRSYPGTEGLSDWLTTRCIGLAEDYIGVSLLDTTLVEGSLIPSLADWTAGTFTASCYVSNGGAELLSQSVHDAGTDFARGDQVVVRRLKEGDCFRSLDATSIVSLGSQNLVALVDCGENPQGIFFGTRALPGFSSGAPFPGDNQVRRVAEDLCSVAFFDFFGIESAGFDFRFWRPSVESWKVGDRMVHCAVVDDGGIPENYDPSQYRSFVDLDPADCFDLAPAAPDDFVALDQRLLPRACIDPHVGQKILSGELEAEPDAPADSAPELAGTACGLPASEFLGISTGDSRVNVVGSWPIESAWEEGDRRFGCAVLEASPVSESFEGIGL